VVKPGAPIEADEENRWQGLVGQSNASCASITTDIQRLWREKLYLKIPESKAAKHGLLRIIAESGEDYLYPEAMFRTDVRSTL
jgi:hypothetical protein